MSKNESAFLQIESYIQNCKRGELVPGECHFELATGGSFNGKLENPKIATLGDIPKFLCVWDTSKDMTEWSIPLDSHSSIHQCNPLILYNHPTRAVRGRQWDGSEMDWRHQPTHYGGIHFHDSDIYDFNWECDMEWTVPDGIPSGIYIMRLTNESGEEEVLPLFVCPPLEPLFLGGCKRKKICILVSTFTYGEINYYVVYQKQIHPTFS